MDNLKRYQLRLVVNVDYYGTENSFYLEKLNENPLPPIQWIAEHGDLPDYQQGTIFTFDIPDVVAGTYRFTANDDRGDGQGFTSGNFTLYNDTTSEIIATASGNWGQNHITVFTLN